MGTLFGKYVRCSVCMNVRPRKDTESIGPGFIVSDESGKYAKCSCGRGFVQVFLLIKWTDADKEKHKKEIESLNRSEGCCQGWQNKREGGDLPTYNARLREGFKMLNDNFND